MRTGLLMLCALAALLVASSCSDSPSQPPAKPRVTKAERAAATEAALAKTPIPRRYKIDGHDLLVIDVPMRESYGDTLEIQRCFVWRDAEFKVATLSCPHEAEEAPPIAPGRL